MVDKISGLFLYIKESGLSYLDDWIDAFRDSDFYKLKFYDLRISYEKIIKEIKNLEKNQFIIIGHSCLRTIPNIELFIKIVPLLKERKSKLIVFIGDELNLHHCPLSKKITVLKQIYPDIICTQLLQEAGIFLYSDIKSAKIFSLPHALNPNVFKVKKDFKNREIDIGLITTPYPIYLGDIDRELLIEKLINLKGFKVHIKKSYGKNAFRLDRDGWVDYLNSIKATASTEAGTFYIEKDDSTLNSIMQFLQEIERDKKKIMIRSNDLFLKVNSIVPTYIKKLLKKIILETPLNNFISYDTNIVFDKSYFNLVYEKFFKDKKIVVYGKAISSRHFDAIGTGTIQLLVEGRYNDILKADEHYIPIKRDFSNFDEAVNKLKDQNFCKKIIMNALGYILDKHTYYNRVKQLYDFIIENL